MSHQLISWAADIKRAHIDALHHAGSAVEYARQAGALLMKVKDALPHGAFVAWVEANCGVSARQAQRYMRAAQGKPLPLRKVAELPAPKSDTVSLFPTVDGLVFDPSCMTIMSLTASGWHDTVFIVPSSDHPGFSHYAHCNGPEDPAHGTHVTFSQRPIRNEALPYIVQLHMQGWRGATVTAQPHDGTDCNPFSDEGMARRNMFGQVAEAH